MPSAVAAPTNSTSRAERIPSLVDLATTYSTSRQVRATINGGLGANVFNFTGTGSYYAVGNGLSNQLNLLCVGSEDALDLSQNGSSISVFGTITGTSINWTATNMSGVALYGSQAGYDWLWAYGMTQGVDVIGYGGHNTLFGGQGPDTLDGGDGGNNYIVAENNRDVIYFSGDNSYYYGAGENTFVYRATQ